MGRSLADRGVHAAEPAARDGAQESRACEAGPSRHRHPPLIAERVRHPRVAAVGSVLDDDQPAAFSKHRVHRGQDRLFVAHVVQRVRHQDAIEVLKVQRACEVGDSGLEASRDRPQHVGILVHRDDVGLRSKDVREGEREGALAGPEVGPPAAPPFDAVLNERYVIGVIQLARGPSARPLT